MAEKDLIIEEPRTLDYIYPPSSLILPISHNDISAEDTHGKKGLWDSANETQRAMKSRHLTMIGMYPSNSGTVLSSKSSFAQLLVVPSVQGYF